MRRLFREFVVARRAAQREHERQIALAWNAAAMNAQATVGKLPDLKVVLRRVRGVEKQEPSEQRSAVSQIAANLGKSFRQMRLIRKTT